MAAPEVFFLPAISGGQRLCVWHRPAHQPAAGAVLYLHPFAEEMNKCRRMAAMQSRALAAAGFGVLQIDLLGCGDSSGDFADATWSDWLADAACGVAELRRRCGQVPVWLWGARAGALLACAARRGEAGDAHLLLWQPVTSGKVVLQQFLRLKAAADLAGGGKGVTEGLRQSLAAGQAVEVAGYGLGAALARSLEQAVLERPADGACRTIWLELSNRDDPLLAPASQSLIERWRGEGAQVQALAVRGPAFWQTVEIEDAPALVTATVTQVTAVARTMSAVSTA